VRRLLVEEACRLDRELYLGVVVDRDAAAPVLIVSGGRGTAAEKIAALESAGIVLAQSPADMGQAIRRALGKA
jgi:succinyl-CoA synthetase beta subunit